MHYFKLFTLLFVSLVSTAFGQTNTYRFNIFSQECKKLITPEGSAIFVEEGAFDRATDTIVISYTEYRSVVDMVLNDIRMHMALGTDRLQLESSGMFRISASANGVPVTLNENKRIAVQMALEEKPKWPTQAYQYDSINKSWAMYNAEVMNTNVANDEGLWGSSSERLPESSEFVEWDDPFGTFEADQELRNEVFQMMEIDEFGLYNYDRMLDGVEYEYVQPLFVDGQDKPINTMIYMVYRGINSVFYFPQYTWESQFFTIVGGEYQLFTIVDGEVHVASSEPVKTTEGVKYVLNKVSTKTDLRSTLTELLAEL